MGKTRSAFLVEINNLLPINRWQCNNMAAKVKFNRLESEIEKCRAERSWLKALEVAKQLANKYQHLG